MWYFHYCFHSHVDCNRRSGVSDFFIHRVCFTFCCEPLLIVFERYFTLIQHAARFCAWPRSELSACHPPSWVQFFPSPSIFFETICLVKSVTLAVVRTFKLHNHNRNSIRCFCGFAFCELQGRWGPLNRFSCGPTDPLAASLSGAPMPPGPPRRFDVRLSVFFFPCTWASYFPLLPAFSLLSGDIFSSTNSKSRADTLEFRNRQISKALNQKNRYTSFQRSNFTQSKMQVIIFVPRIRKDDGDFPPLSRWPCGCVLMVFEMVFTSAYDECLWWVPQINP